MSMHDKDMDALFRSKLNDLEVEATAGAWAGINSGLHGKRRKSITPILRIAASIIVVLSVGVFFLLKDKKADQIPLKNKLVKNQPVKPPVPVQPVIANSVNSVQQLPQKVQSKRQLAAVAHHYAPVVQQALVKEEVQPAAAPVNQSTLLQKDSAAFMAANHLTLPATPVSIKPAATLPDLVLTPTSKPGNEENQEAVKKPRIHGLGSLLNVVIASIDKREDKVIEFTDTDEGDRITGINLGIIRIKKQN